METYVAIWSIAYELTGTVLYLCQTKKCRQRTVRHNLSYVVCVSRIVSTIPSISISLLRGVGE